MFVVGSTAGITVVEYEPGLVKDLEDLFNKVNESEIESGNVTVFGRFHGRDHGC